MCSLTINISTHACVASMHFKNASLKQRNKLKQKLLKMTSLSRKDHNNCYGWICLSGLDVIVDLHHVDITDIIHPQSSVFVMTDWLLCIRQLICELERKMTAMQITIPAVSVPCLQSSFTFTTYILKMLCQPDGLVALWEDFTFFNSLSCVFIKDSNNIIVI